MNPDQAAALRAEFPAKAIGKIDRGRGVVLDYVGHAAATDRLLAVDPAWTWEPLAIGPDGLPAFDKVGGLWIRLTVAGVTRLGYGDAGGKSPSNAAVKEAIGDAIRNAAMRFGVALDLWAKEDLSVLHDSEDTPPGPSPRSPSDAGSSGSSAPSRSPEESAPTSVPAVAREPGGETTPQAEGADDADGSGTRTVEGAAVPDPEAKIDKHTQELLKQAYGSNAAALKAARNAYPHDGILSISHLTVGQASALIEKEMA